jgi:large subunit ribosomal protein L4
MLGIRTARWMWNQNAKRFSSNQAKQNETAKTAFVTQHFDRESMHPTQPTTWLTRVDLWRMDMVQSWLRSWQTGQNIGLIQLDKTVFNAPKRIDLLHRAVMWQNSLLASGNVEAKTRSDVRGSTRKMRPQKGTGKARLGSRTAPSMQGGGAAHGPVLHNPSLAIQYKVVDHAKRIALSTKFAQDELLIVDDLSMPTNKTTDALDVLHLHSLQDTRCLLVYGNPEPETNLILGMNNLKNVLTVGAMEVDVLNLLKYDLVILDKSAVVSLEQQLSLLEEYK